MKSVLEKSNSFLTMYPISAKLLALNITHPITINIIAYIHCTNLGSLFNNLPNKNFSIIRIIPKYNPHIIKFHAAPCHNPVSAHTTNILNICLSFFTLFPPKGI